MVARPGVRVQWKHASELEQGDRFELGFTVMEVVSVNAHQIVAKRERDGELEIVSTFDDRYRMVPGCAACEGDPEAHGLHVCGKEPFA